MRIFMIKETLSINIQYLLVKGIYEIRGTWVYTTWLNTLVRLKFTVSQRTLLQVAYFVIREDVSSCWLWSLESIYLLRTWDKQYYVHCWHGNRVSFVSCGRSPYYTQLSNIASSCACGRFIRVSVYYTGTQASYTIPHLTCSVYRYYIYIHMIIAVRFKHLTIKWAAVLDLRTRFECFWKT